MKQITFTILLFLSISSSGYSKKTKTKTYYPNGQLKSVEIIKDSLTIGKKKQYYSNGQLQSIENYNEYGKPCGEWKQYYENGQLKEIGIFVDSLKVAEWLFFDEKGKLTGAHYFNSEWRPAGWNYDQLALAERCNLHGRNWKLKMYYPNNQLQSKGKYKNGYREGKWKYYYPDGNLKEKGRYKQWKKEGTWKRYHNNGVMMQKTTFKNGLTNGKSISFFNNGQIKNRSTNVEGSRVGPIERYQENGDIDTLKKTFNEIYLENLNGQKIENYYLGETAYIVIITENIVDGIASLQLIDDEIDLTIYKILNTELYNSAICDYPIQADTTRIKINFNAKVKFEPTNIDTITKTANKKKLHKL